MFRRILDSGETDRTICSSASSWITFRLNRSRSDIIFLATNSRGHTPPPRDALGSATSSRPSCHRAARTAGWLPARVYRILEKSHRRIFFVLSVKCAFRHRFTTFLLTSACVG
jgi:hypothetical protein